MSRICAFLGALLVGLGGIGLLLAATWYHDDACTIEQYQCTLGTLGFFGLFLIPLGGLLLATSGVAALIAYLRR